MEKWILAIVWVNNSIGKCKFKASRVDAFYQDGNNTVVVMNGIQTTLLMSYDEVEELLGAL